MNTHDQRFKLLSDDDGHNYIVPVDKEQEFNRWLDFTCNELGDWVGEDFDQYSIGVCPTCVTFTAPQVLGVNFP